MKKVLMISYHFPPDCAVGALRPARFARYLPEFGYEPYVVSVRDRYYDGTNYTGYVPKNIYKTFMLPSPNILYKYTKEMIYRLRKQDNILEYSKGTYALKKKLQMAEPERIFAKAKRIINSISCLPDDKIGWLPFGFIQACRLIIKEKIGCLITTSPPHSTHLIGFMLKRYLDIKWIADFRDPWWINYSGGKPSWVKSQLSDYCEQKMEEKVVTRADKIILVTERLKEGYEKYYPEIDKKKCIVIPNGYDIEDFPVKPHFNKFNKFTLTYTGSFYHGRTPSQLFVATRELIEEGKISKDNIEIKLIGYTKYAEGTSVIEMARRQGIESLVALSDSIPHKEALEYMMKSHVLLLFAPDQYYQVPAKAYEYMASGSHIIAFTKEGATRDLIEDYEMGVIVNPDNIAEIKDAVYSYYKRYLESCVSGKEIGSICQFKGNEINKFNRRELTRKLVSII